MKRYLITILFAGLLACQQQPEPTAEAPQAENAPPTTAERKALAPGPQKKQSAKVADDTVRYEMVKLEKSLDDCKAGDEPCTRMTLAFPQIQSTSGENAARLQQHINRFLAQADNEESIAAAPSALLDQHIQNYQENLREYPEDADLAWVEERTIQVRHNAPQTLALEMAQYAYYGGAHPNSMTLYQNLNPQNGTVITLNDLFKPGYEEKLQEIAEAKFRADRDMTAGESYESRGFQFKNNRFALNENYSIGKEGILFCYNPYEIGPYAMGAVELFLPYSALKAILK